MKIITLLSMFVGLSSFANSVESHLSNIQDRVRNCNVLPYGLKSGVKVYRHLVSHCPEVRLIEKYRARVKVAGHVFFAQLIETPDTDGDFFDVVIRDYISNDTYTLHTVLAYGDVMRGILGGDLNRVPQVYQP